MVANPSDLLHIILASDNRYPVILRPGISSNGRHARSWRAGKTLALPMECIWKLTAPVERTDGTTAEKTAWQ
jgi:hypothetical protein